MELMYQPFTGQLGYRIIELLDSSDYHTLNILVAFAKNSGVLRIKDSIEKFRERGGTVNIYVGVDMGGTSYEALTNLLHHTDSLNVVHSEKKDQTFHPKIYQLLGLDKGLIVIGSHNLTGGGLWTNFESSVLIPLDGESTDNALNKGIENYIGQLISLGDSFMSIGAQRDIEKLLQDGYIFKEVTQQLERSRAAKRNGKSNRLFGMGAPAELPRIGSPKKKKAGVVSTLPKTPTSVTQSDESQTIWFETRKMTSESRNILDLSMRSLVERGDPTGTTLDLGEPGFMRGGVVFFGLNPLDKDYKKAIALNFEGVDYLDNKILFPVGQKANGTWRLQIHGKSSSNVKITEVFKDLNTAEGERYNDKGELLLYLQLKIITFTKIQDDYYYMSVFPESELDNFKAASRILARNGASKTSRWIGLF